MSRIGKQPIELPAGVSVSLGEGRVKVVGPKGALEFTLRPEISARVEDGKLVLLPAAKSRKTPAYWGTARAVLARLVEGVSRGFEKKLELEGIGYRAALDGTTLVLAVGFSHPVRIQPSAGISFRVEKNTVTVAGIDPVLVGDFAARIHKIRPPEPYKGTGIRYAGEVIRRKAGKKAVAAGT